MPEYSISQLGTFEDCALQYRLIYVDRIKRYEEGVEAFLGRRFIKTYVSTEKRYAVTLMEDS